MTIEQLTKLGVKKFTLLLWKRGQYFIPISPIDQDIIQLKVVNPDYVGRHPTISRDTDIVIGYCEEERELSVPGLTVSIRSGNLQKVNSL